MDAIRRDTVMRLQRALTVALRPAAVPQVHERVIRRAGVEIDRVEAIALSRIVDRGDMRLTELARRLGVASSTAGRHAAHLDERGLCVRSIDPADGRAVVVAATPAGRDLIARLPSAHGEILAEVLAEWKTSDLEELSAFLERLSDDLVGITAVEPAAGAAAP